MSWNRRLAEQTLRQRFGLEEFRPGQREAVRTLMNGRDVVAVFPTGAGKSLCYQLPALMLSGLTLVISPLISLMRDQVDSLTRRGIPAAALNSLQTREEQQRMLTQAEAGAIRLLYVSPERLTTPAFAAFARSISISLLVVDEAHCVVQWGGSFRPAYERIGEFVSTLPARPVCCAMTATTDRKMLRAITGSLGLRKPAVLRLPLIRPNLRFSVRTTLRPERELRRLLMEHRGQRGVVFCATRSRCEYLAGLMTGWLREAGEGKAAFYHAGMNREERERVQEDFAAGRIAVLAATSAFGMGVDIPDIRYVIHDALPPSLTDYAQQSGRAGRDGESADCVQLLSLRDIELLRRRYYRQLRQAAPDITPKSWLKSLRERRALREDWREQRKALDLFLSGACIPAALSRHFGVRARNCGHCPRCQEASKKGRFQRLAPTPDLFSWDDYHLRCWALQWQRGALARARYTTPGRILPQVELQKMAQYGIPPGIPLDAEIHDALTRVMEAVSN